MATLYRTIVADPPWPYKGRGPASSKTHRPNSYGASPSSVERYGRMSIKEICSLQVPSEKNSHLYLWTTNQFMEEAHQVAKAWGFVTKTILTWVKIKRVPGMRPLPNGFYAITEPDLDDSAGAPSKKTGHYFRGATEHVLFAVRGSLRLCGEAEATWFGYPRLEHSRKPPPFYRLVERQSTAPCYLEMHARPVTPLFEKMPGWDTWGNEMRNDVIIPDLASVASEAGR